MRRRQTITRPPRHRPDIITAATEGFVPPALAAGEPLAAPERKVIYRPWALGAALLLHALVLAVALFVRGQPVPQDEQSPPGISVVLDNGGAQQATAPPAPRQGAPELAAAPPPPPPPPPAPPQVETNLQALEVPLGELPPPPPRPEPPQPRPVPRSPPHYVMMMNGMSLGNPSPAMPAPPARQGLNLDMPQSNAEAASAPELSVKGDIGADWDAALNQWVEAHKYYPQAAAEQNQQGDVQVEFNVDRQGNVTGLHMLSGSGSPFLDQAWYGLFQGAQLPAFPAGTKSDHITVDATMHFQIIQ